LLTSLLVTGAVAHAAAPQKLRSPDGRIEVRVDLADRVRYGVFLKDQPLLRDSTLSITIDGVVLGATPKLRSAKTESVDRFVEPVVKQKAGRLRERYNQLRLELQGGLAVTFRDFDDGVAYRLETSLAKAEVKVDREEAAFNFAGDYAVYYPKERRLLLSQRARVRAGPPEGGGGNEPGQRAGRGGRPRRHQGRHRGVGCGGLPRAVVLRARAERARRDVPALSAP
jgi:hypothetical protein